MKSRNAEIRCVPLLGGCVPVVFHSCSSYVPLSKQYVSSRRLVSSLFLFGQGLFFFFSALAAALCFFRASALASLVLRLLSARCCFLQLSLRQLSVSLPGHVSCVVKGHVAT